MTHIGFSGEAVTDDTEEEGRRRRLGASRASTTGTGHQDAGDIAKIVSARSIHWESEARAEWTWLVVDESSKSFASQRTVADKNLPWGLISRFADALSSCSKMRIK
jgi:hypothetical protein